MVAQPFGEILNTTALVVSIQMEMDGRTQTLDGPQQPIVMVQMLSLPTLLNGVMKMETDLAVINPETMRMNVQIKLELRVKTVSVVLTETATDTQMQATHSPMTVRNGRTVMETTAETIYPETMRIYSLTIQLNGKTPMETAMATIKVD